VGRVRLQDVAARAQVDPSTASRVLAGLTDKVKDETAKRVLAASRELGYTPNAFARALRTRRTGSIGVVLPEFSNPVYAAVIDGIEERAAELGLSVVIDAIRPGNPGDFARLVSENRVDGVLFSAASDRSVALDVLDATAVPYVLVNRSVAEATASVVLDEESGVEAAVRCLVEHGHTRIAYVSGPPGIDTARRRKSGFLKTMKRLKLPVDRRLVVAAFEPETAQAATAALLAVDPPPTAICVWTIKSALGVLHALHEHAVPIPEAVSVIAMPDVWLAAYCWPPLTTVAMPLGVMGGRAVDLLASMVAGERPERVVVTSPRPRIVMRKSVGPVSISR
jgi:LacI family transcriptional regulator, galactose operon repressor